MKKSQYRIILLALLTMFSLLLFTACQPASTPTTAESQLSAETSSESGPVYDDDPIVDMEGYEFVIGSAWMRARPSANATEFEKLFFDHKAEVEEKYHCTIKISSIYADMNTMMPRIMAGNKVADVIEMMADMWLPASKAGYIIPWNDVEGINIEDPRWVDAYTNLSTFDGKNWGLNFMRPPEVRSCVFFNKDLLANNGITEDPYQLVRDGNWTYEKFREMALAATKDLDSDGQMDTYGVLVISPILFARQMINANGAALATLEDGKVNASYDSQGAIEALNFVDTLVNQDKSFMLWDYMKSETTWNNVPAYEDIYAVFNEGKAAFFVHESWVGNQQIKPNSDKIRYGMLPLPKGPGATDYVSPAHQSRVFTVTSTNTDLDKTTIIFNALARPMEGYEGDEWWLDEVQREYFQDDDEDSVDMYKLNLEKSMVDLGSGVEKLSFDYGITAIAASVFWRYGTPAAQVATMVGNYQDAIDAIFNK